MAIAQILKHDFKSKGNLYLYNSNNNCIYYENSDGYWSKRDYDDNNKLIYHEDSTGYWVKRDYDVNGNKIYYEDSDGYWEKQEFDTDGNEIYFENSNGYIVDNRPKKSCEGKIVEIDGKKYQLKEVD